MALPGVALKDKIALGMALPHRSPEPIDMASVRRWRSVPRRSAFAICG